MLREFDISGAWRYRNCPEYEKMIVEIRFLNDNELNSLDYYSRLMMFGATYGEFV
jgi:hypothetical protein